jgi:hypothetical protein
MRLRRLTLAACLLAVAAPLGLAACGDEHPGVDEPAREGLALELDGVTYNVFITRQLNPRVPPDGAYVTDEAPPGSALYGIFIQVCNHTDEAHETVSEFVVKDNQENEFEPEELPADNHPDECIPEAGSVAQLGPSAGSMLLFEFPLETTENRPLELEMEGESGDTLTFELDI